MHKHTARTPETASAKVPASGNVPPQESPTAPGMDERNTRLTALLDGPTVDDLAREDTRGIAEHDARWVAWVLAGQADDAAQLRGWLAELGLIAVPWSAPGGAR